MDETFPPCFNCEHPMLVLDGLPVISAHICEACGAHTFVPYAYPREETFNIGFDDLSIQ